MYVVNWTAHGGYDGYYDYTKEKTVFSVIELIDLLSDIQDEENVTVETI